MSQQANSPELDRGLVRAFVDAARLDNRVPAQVLTDLLRRYVETQRAFREEVRRTVEQINAAAADPDSDEAAVNRMCEAFADETEGWEA